MIRVEDNTRKRLLSEEQNALVEVMAVVDRLNDVEQNEPFWRRLCGIRRAKWRTRVARSLLLRLISDVLDTVPREQLIHMQDNLPRVKCWIYIGDKLPAKPDKVEGRFLRNRELNVCAEAIRECCAVCDIPTQKERRRCPRAKLMNCMGINRVNEDTADCGWFDTLLGYGGE